MNKTRQKTKRHQLHASLLLGHTKRRADFNSPHSKLLQHCSNLSLFSVMLRSTLQRINKQSMAIKREEFLGGMPWCYLIYSLYRSTTPKSLLMEVAPTYTRVLDALCSISLDFLKCNYPPSRSHK